jgi:hypothetical protein
VSPGTKQIYLSLALHFSALHFSALHFSALHFSALHFSAIHFSVSARVHSRQAPTAIRRRPTRSWEAEAAATLTALRMATDDEDPWLITQMPSTPSNTAPP